jgi:putative hydrolase of HD superfamily
MDCDDERPLAESNPFPDGIPARLRQQLTFLVEADRLKTVLRRSPLAAADRRENDAEHSWHLALMAVVLAEYADEPVDIGRVVQLVVVHDMVEIYAGPAVQPATGGSSRLRTGNLGRIRGAADR